MAELPFPWNIYEERQQQLLRSHRLTDQIWAVESGLDALLGIVENGRIDPDLQCDLDRTIASKRWTERNRARLRRKFLPPPPEFDHLPQRHPASFSPAQVESQLLARIRLSRVRAGVTAREWKIIIAAASGYKCELIAHVCGGSAGSIRTIVSRLRSRLRLVA